MYRLAVRRDFVSQHFLVGGDWGRENTRHSHHYVLEVRLEGDQLDQHGYLVDIVAVEALLDRLVDRYRDQTLNEFAEFAGLNPSLEHFARIICHAVGAELAAAPLTAVETRLWEDANAWAAYRLDRAR
jgi:6-pyruvoyltetrahydropterin/6-carboxytetrahydropterin synthase